MQAAILEVRPDLKDQLDHLADEMHRSEADLANEAISLYLAHQRRIAAKIHEGLAQARKGEFVPDDEMDAFFAEHGEAGV